MIVTFISLCLLLNPVHAREPKYIFTIASLAPKNVGWAKHVREIIVKRIKKSTNGEICIKFFWNGSKGSEKDYIEMINNGQLDGAALSGYGTALACPEMNVLQLPFIFNNYEEVDYIRNKMYHIFEAIAEKNGYKLFIWTDQDFDQLYSMTLPMVTMDDFKKAKFASCFGQLEMSVLKHIGASPIEMDVESGAAALRKGIVDTFIGPAMWVVGSQLYIKVNYVNPLKIRYAPSTALISLRAWNRIPDKYKTLLTSFRKKEVLEFIYRNRKDSDRAYQAMLKYGLKESIMKEKDITHLKKQCEQLWKPLSEKFFDITILNEMLSHLKTYREIKKAMPIESY